jgi:hypothetical protein
VTFDVLMVKDPDRRVGGAATVAVEATDIARHVA